jgi:hypothetical protein
MPEEARAPYAITMWDFSWLERRWPGAGYEDWDEALDGLVERGYNAARIDPYPHLIHADAGRTWELLPPWSTQDWGAPARVKVRVWPELETFLGKCRDRRIGVALSTWFREDTTNQRLLVPTPQHHARIWESTLSRIENAGLLDTVLYVDLCNEWPLDVWAPFFKPPKDEAGKWQKQASLRWMAAATSALRQRYPRIPLTFSFTTELLEWRGVDVSFLDFLEPHQWMIHHNDFYERIGYAYQRFEAAGYEAMVRHAEPLYRSDPDHWDASLVKGIHNLADWSRASGKALATTECWALVDYKDWPGLDWGYIKDLCDLGTRTAAATGRWWAIATSNFCGPQFRGMWRDVAWHQRLTSLIRASNCQASLQLPAAPHDAAQG